MNSIGLILWQAAEDEDGAVKEGLLELILKGGILSLIIIGILLVLSVIAVAIFFERWRTIKKAGKIDQAFVDNIRASVAAHR